MEKVARWSTGASMKKLLRWTVYIFAAIGFLICSAALCITLLDPARTLVWHCFHSNKRNFEGHTYFLPIWWRPIAPWKSEALALTRARSVEFESFPAFSIYEDPKGIKDENSVVELQQKMITMLTRPSRDGRPSVIHASAETIHSTSLIFYCWKREPTSSLTNLTCGVPGTDWIITIDSDPKTEREGEQILQSFH